MYYNYVNYEILLAQVFNFFLIGKQFSLLNKNNSGNVNIKCEKNHHDITHLEVWDISK